jgi:CRISPR system Cascade subunit CasC
MLIEIHLVQNHAPSNLNRDETGSPKECVFGGARRARISSQCLKRSIRRSEQFQAELADHLANRTRRLPELVREKLKAAGIPDDLAAVAAKKATGFGTEAGTERDPNKKTEQFETAQTMFLTEGDVQAVTDVLLSACQEQADAAKLEKVAAKELQAKAKQAGFRPITVDIALFGRMITSGAFRDVEAATQVAHALSTHKVETEFDYFTAVDDLMQMGETEEDAGADMIGDVEYNSACYYKYFSLDVQGLVDNLTGRSFMRRTPSDEEEREARKLAVRTIEAFLRAATFATPSGKQNSFAAHQLPSLVLIEARACRTPVSYANAFVDPARPGKEGDLVKVSMDKLKTHAEALTKGFNLQSAPRLLLAPLHPNYAIDGVERVDDLEALCKRLRETLGHG